MIADAREAEKYTPTDSPWLFRPNGKPLAPKAIGKIARQRLEQGITGLGKLVDACKSRHKSRGAIKGLDGRMIKTRSEHSALNSLLQSFGAIIMKHALAIFHFELAHEAGYVADDFVTLKHFAYLCNIHDEIELEIDPDHAEKIGELVRTSIRLAGERLGCKCPLSGTTSIGANWKEVH